MGQTLTHGVYLPDEGERNCYAGLAANWQLLDNSVGTIAEHTTALAGKAPAVHTHTKSDVTDLLNSNFIPSANNSYDLGSSSYQWNNVYSKNYYYNGVAWGLDKSNEWTANNKFNKPVAPNDITGIDSNTMAFTALKSVIFFNTTGSSNRQSYGTFLYSGYIAGSKPDNYGQLQLLRSTDKKGETNNGLIPDTSFTMWRVAPHYLIMDFMNAVRVTNDGTENSLKPITNNTTDLGTSTRKWKTLNGVNPGALSLPDLNTAQTIDRTGWVYDGSTYNSIKLSSTDTNMTKNGWLYVRINSTGSSDKLSIKYNSIGDKYPTSSFGDTGGGIEVFVPIIADSSVYLCATKDLQFCKFYPCLGNVPSGV